MTPSELYLEYQLPNHVQVDGGWIFLETPWMNSYDDAMLVSGTFQGLLVNYQMTDNWRLTAIGTNAYQKWAQIALIRIQCIIPAMETLLPVVHRLAYNK